MRHLYSALVHLVRPLAFTWVLLRGVRNRRYWHGLPERFGLGSARAGSIWVHAVSLGEVTAAAPVIRALASRHPGVPLVLTTATPTGRERARALFGEEVDVRFLPYDTPGAMRRLITRLQPRVAVIMETELWPNLFHACRRRGIPVVLASARLSPRSVARYRRFGAVFTGVLEGVQVAAQGADDAARFIAIGADPQLTRVTGSVKFDVGVDSGGRARGAALRAAIGARPVWIAGSTHAGEEEKVLDAHAAVLAAAPDALLVLVPRHPERFQAVADLLSRRGLRYERRSSSTQSSGRVSGTSPTTLVLLVDTVGELATWYAAADVAFVGGSLVPVGGHNLLEPAALGVPVITGKHHSNGREIAALLKAAGAVLEVADAPELAAAVGQLLADPARRLLMGERGRQVVEANRGSAQRLLELIEPWLQAGP